MSLLQSLLRKRSHKGKRQVLVEGASHVGLIRPHNEDSYVYARSEDGQSVMLGVADGMGGHEGGEVASFLTVRYLLAAWNSADQETFTSKEKIRTFLRAALCDANEHVYQINSRLDIQWPMGTTATIAVMAGERMVIAHVGDSRCYCFRRHKLFQLTSDQTLVTEMIKRGGMTPAEAAMHPLSHTLTNCIGTQHRLEIDFKLQTVLPGDRYLFCSDGLSSLVGPKELCRTGFEAKAPADEVSRMIAHALEGGGTDNITAVCMFVD